MRRVNNVDVEQDLARARAMMNGAFGSTVEEVCALCIEGEPRPKARHRILVKDGEVVPYTDGATKADEARLQWHLVSAMRRPLESGVAVAAMFVRSSHQRVDIDNMIKQLFDAANKICWLDDSQVTGLVTLRDVDAMRPRTVAVFARHVTRVRLAPERTTPTRAVAGRGREPRIRQVRRAALGSLRRSRQ